MKSWHDRIQWRYSPALQQEASTFSPNSITVSWIENIWMATITSATSNFSSAMYGDVQWSKSADLLMTSPPYGDNHTTVTYGQASYLPLKCIRWADITEIPPEGLLDATTRIDSLSLGGSYQRSKGRLLDLENICERSPTLRTICARLRSAPSDRWRRIATFYSDFEQALHAIYQDVRPRGYLVMVTGDRCVGGVRIPMSSIVSELLAEATRPIATIVRRIPRSRTRLPPRNSHSDSIRTETILVSQRRN